MSGLQIEEGKWYRTRGGVVVGPARKLNSADGLLRFEVRGEWYRENGSCVSWSNPIDLVEEAPAPLPQNPVDIAIAAEIDAETAATTFGPIEQHTPPDSAWQPADRAEADGVEVKEWPYRVIPSGYDEIRIEEVGDFSLDVLVATRDHNRNGIFIPDQKMADPRRAVDIAGKAASLVGGDRDRQHGAKHDNFRRIAGVWNAWLAIRKEPAAPLDAHDVGCMMALMKLARTQSGALNVDDYVDACGYAACAGEVAQINET